MIPYDILAGKIEYKSEVKNENVFHDREKSNQDMNLWMDIRILDLAPDYFTFRLVREEKKRKDITAITLDFYQYENQKYETICLTEFEIQVREETKFWTEYQISLENSGELNDYKKLSLELSREYLAYMEKKLTLSDRELAASMTSYPWNQDEEYASDMEEQFEIWRNEMVSEGSLSKNDYHKFSLLLDNPIQYERFLAGELDERLTNGGFQPFSGIHVGNSFCPNLLPEEKLLPDIMKKAEENNLIITWVIPPVPQSLWQEMLQYLKKLQENIQKNGQKNIQKTLLESSQKGEAVLEVNDLGMKRELSKPQWNHFQIQEGILLHKTTKDSRWKYRKDYEKSPKVMNFDQSDGAVYYPLFQTNTGTFCTLYANKYAGGRGLQRRILSCDRPCLQECFLYPKHLNMIGRYNSIFGMNKNLPEEVWEKNSDRWVVINL